MWGHCPTQSRTSSVGPSPHVGPPGSGSGVCVRTRVQGSHVQRGIRFIVVSVLGGYGRNGGVAQDPLGGCGGHLCLTLRGCVSLNIWQRVRAPRSPSASVSGHILGGSWGLCLCPAWLLTDLHGFQRVWIVLLPPLDVPGLQTWSVSGLAASLPSRKHCLFSWDCQSGLCVDSCPQVCHPV